MKKKTTLYRGLEKKYDKCLFVPSALRGYWPKHYPFSAIGCCNSCVDIPKVEKRLQDLETNTNLYKEACKTISKEVPFQDCADDMPYIFWLSIVFCERHVGKNLSFSGGGPIPYGIDMGFDNDGELKPPICAWTIEEYAREMAQLYFEHNPPDICDWFIRKSMEFQHYCKESWDYSEDVSSKYCKCSDGALVNMEGLPEHFTFFLDWTECKHIAEDFAKEDGTIISIDSEKYDQFVGANYRMSYDDELFQSCLVHTAKCPAIQSISHLVPRREQRR
jgi:hypothetical protein